MDLIDRRAVIDALGEKPLAWTESEYELGLQNQWQSDVDALKALPSAQPEIIRCKDCKWYAGDIMANPWGVCCHDGWVGGHIGHEVSERGWCYRAERRTDE